MTIPAYNEEKWIRTTIQSIPAFVDCIVIVDDGSIDETSKEIQKFVDQRILVIKKENGGVGSAVKAGHLELINRNCDLLVVVAGDNQMDQELMPLLLDKFADDFAHSKVLFVKGNRLHNKQLNKNMPFFRKYGNYFFSICTWLFLKSYVSDPLNGYTCIDSSLYGEIIKDGLEDGYEYEISIIIHLIRRNIDIHEIPMASIYRDEVSNIRPISTTIRIFLKIVEAKLNEERKKKSR